MNREASTYFTALLWLCNSSNNPKEKMKRIPKIILLTLVFGLAVGVGAPAQAADKKPNILFIMGDDIGWMQPSCYHRGLMVGETPNIDRIANEGAIMMHYYAEQSCTAGRTAFFTGMHPLRVGMIPPQLPGSPTYLYPEPRRSPSSSWISATTPVSSARTIWATIPMLCPRPTASRSSGAISITWTRCRA